jgi:hypothetical protein
LNCPGLTPADGSIALTSSASARRKDHPGVVYRNVGTTTAHAVTAVPTINNQRFDLTFGDVEPNGLIEHEASDLFHYAAEQDEVNIRNASSAGIALVSGPSFKVTERLSWRSELGTPSIWTLKPLRFCPRVRSLRSVTTAAPGLDQWGTLKAAPAPMGPALPCSARGRSLACRQYLSDLGDDGVRGGMLTARGISARLQRDLG